MNARVTLGDVFAAYWDDLSIESRRRHLAMWLIAWGAAMAASYVTCKGCGVVHGGIAWSRLDRVRGVVNAVTTLENGEVRHIEANLCSCGWALISERKFT